MTRQDDASFTAFVEAASPGLLRVAWLLCGDESTAEDLVQEALARVYPRWRRLGADDPVPYARKILVNLNIDRFRRSGRESVTADGSLPDAGSAGSPVEDRDQVVRLLQRLPRREREVVVLRHYADLSERQVADQLGISIGNVKAAGSRGLATLRSLLASTNHEVTS